MSREPNPPAITAVNGREWVSPQAVVIPVLVLVNLTATILLPKVATLQGVALGGLYGEAAWLAAWAAIGPGCWWCRTARMVAYSLLLYGECLLVAPLPLDEKWGVLRMVPVLVLCMQVPVSLVKNALRLEIVCDSQPVEPSRNPRQFGIADLLVATGIVAASVAWAGLAVLFFAAVAVPTQLLILPSLAAGFVARNAAVGTVWLLCYALIVATFFAASFCLVFRQAELVEQVAQSFSTMAGFTLTMHGSVMVARALGFHLRRVPA